MIENISIPIVLNERTCRINVKRTLFSNDDDQITIVWYEDGEEIEHCYMENLLVSEKNLVLKAIENYDKELVKKSL